MTTAEEAAREHGRNHKFTSHWTSSEEQEHSFLAGVAHCQSIWRKPSERPEVGPMLYIVVKDYRLVRGHFNSFDEKDWDEACVRDEVKTWAYLSDLLSLLPDWAKEEQK